MPVAPHSVQLPLAPTGAQHSTSACAVLAGGSSRMALPGLPGGTVQLTATYDGDSSYAASSSAGAALTVTARTPDLVVDDSKLAVGGEVTLQLTGFLPNETVDLTLHSDPDPDPDPVGSGVAAGGLALLALGLVMVAIRRTRRSALQQESPVA